MTQSRHKLKIVFANILTVVFSILVGFLFFEVSIRLISDRVELFYFENFVSRTINFFDGAYPSVYHPNLGYIPKPGSAGTKNYWGKSVTILEHGIRSNGKNKEAPGARGSVILAVGDSFTFGDQVSDRDAWPAYLDTFTKENVINGGVFGYGLDQTVLRLEELVKIFDVKIALVGFIPEDIYRAQLSKRSGVAKPYFIVDDGRLVRKNRPVPRDRPVKEEIGLLRSVLGYSYLVHWTVNQLGLTEWWLVGQWENREMHVQGVQVSCLLTKRLGTLRRKAGIRIVMVAQYLKEVISESEKNSKSRNRARAVLDCAKSNGLDVLDFYQPLQKIFQSDPDLYDSYFDSHMTAAGNRFVAEQIARYLQLN